MITARVTAVIAYNDVMALGVLARLAERGVAVPAEVSVVGFDDISFAAMATPALTTVDLRGEWAGRAAVDALLDTLAARDGVGRSALDSALVVRASTGPVRS